MSFLDCCSELRMVGILVFSGISISNSFEDTDFLVSVLFAAKVGVIIGNQYIPGFHFFFGPSISEWRFSVPIIAVPSVETGCVSFSFRIVKSLMCFPSFLLFAPLSSSNWSFL